jgi:hypothetical protein
MGLSIYPGLSIPAYFDLNDLPVVVRDGTSLPQVLKNGRWETLYEPGPVKLFHEAERITKEEFDQLVAQSGGR